MLKVTQHEQNDFQIMLLRNFEEIDTIRNVWKNLQYHPNTDYDFYQTIIRNRPEVCYPLVMVFKKESGIKSIIVCRVENRILPCKIGYTTIFSSKLKSLNILYAGFLGDRSDDVLRSVLNQITILIKNKEIEIAELSFIDVSGTLYAQYLQSISPIYRELYYRPQPHYLMQLPESEDDLFKEMSAHHRNTILSNPRKMEKSFKNKLDLKNYQLPTDIDSLCQDAEHVASRSYQRKLGVGFFNTTETHERLRIWAEKGMLFSCILYIEEQPVSFWIGTAYNNIFVSDYIGFDPKFSKYSPGKVCIVYLMRNLIKSNKNIKIIDFNFGEAPYKKQFGTQCIIEASALIYAPRLYFIPLLFVRKVTGLLNVFILTTIRKLNLELRIKKIIRSA